MKALKDIIRITTPKAATSERAELIGLFTDKINAERKGTKYKKLPARAIAVKLSHLSVSDCYYLKSILL